MGGFDAFSLYFNLSYLFNMGKSRILPQQIKRLFPWILWRIWKNRNLFLFEARAFHPLETQQKIEDDAEKWSMAQIVDNEREEEEKFDQETQRMWLPPPTSWFKCNIGIAWSKKKSMVGSAWVLRNEEGKVCLHSRRSFMGVKTKNEATLISILWAVNCMNAHHMNQVNFAVEASEMVGAVNRPKAWPSFSFQSNEILCSLEKMNAWKFTQEPHNANRGATLIAQSASNHPDSNPMWRPGGGGGAFVA
ncbi:hypothetical protein V5N11_000894 [Cardamine amara subsp. amara]|uniref:RNase H type-1 domain-containing protein n=1 Tax=Cardamine amara subsp. amara TaxID=228776 RepID=A0ABD1C511_CARAN